MKNYFKKIETLKTKRTLLQVRKIILTEMNKSYYRNPINIKEEIDLKKEYNKDTSGKETTIVEKMRIYENDFYDFITIKVPIPKVKNLKK